jgi:mRNA interferase MazF
MMIGDIILIPFPFTDFKNKKVRPAVVITETTDKYKDLVVSAISSVIPDKVSQRQIVLISNTTNNLRADSVIKVDRIVTIKREDKIADLGKLSSKELAEFKSVLAEIIR